MVRNKWQQNLSLRVYYMPNTVFNTLYIALT